MKIELITTKKAAEWLLFNTSNRPISKTVVAKYAAAMRSGHWVCNGETIKFAEDGKLIDGQHRLRACVLSGVSFEAYVVRGLASESYDTIDQGTARTLGHLLSRRGERHYNILAASASIVAMLTQSRGGITQTVPSYDSLEFIAKHPDIRESADFASKHKNKLVMPAAIAAMHFMFSQVNPAKAVDFWERVISGERLTDEMPEFRFRSRLIDNQAATAKMRRDVVCALAIKAWNKSIEGKTISYNGLKYFSSEEFPRIVGYQYDTQGNQND